MSSSDKYKKGRILSVGKYVHIKKRNRKIFADDDRHISNRIARKQVNQSPSISQIHKHFISSYFLTVLQQYLNKILNDIRNMIRATKKESEAVSLCGLLLIHKRWN